MQWRECNRYKNQGLTRELERNRVTSKAYKMDKNERVKKVADVEVKREGGLAAATSEAISENEDTFPAESSSEAKRQPGNSLLGRRNTGNNLYIKIPSNATE